ncbi:EBP-domain-containing protein [Hortaea werneckii]|nr:EBP-domain-containing protein [Hortaea werneckii]
MFDVNNSHAVYSMSNWFGSCTDLPDTADFYDSDGPMPSPNVANKKKTTPEKKGQELGERLARKRSQDFATKIQGWNKGGAGLRQQHDEVEVVEDGDDASKKSEDLVEVIVEGSEGGEGGRVLVEDEEGREVKAEDGTEDILLRPKTPGSGSRGTYKMVTSTHTSREVDLERKAWVRRKSKPQVEVPDEIKQATTPKKRVVSDGHWRKDRPPPKSETTTPDRETTTKPITVRRSVVNVGLKVPPSVQNFIEEQQAPVRVRPLRSNRERSRSRSRERTADYEDSGVKVYIKRRPRSKTANEADTSGSSLTAGTSSSLEKRGGSTTDVTSPSQSPTKECAPRSGAEPRQKVSRKSLSADDEEARRERRKTRTPNKEDRSPRSTPKLAEKPSTNPAAPAVPQVHGSRIDRWLAGTQDPFTEDDKSELTPEPLDIKPKKSGRKLDDERGDDHEGRPKSSGRERRSKPDLDMIEVTYEDQSVDESSLSNTPTLRRRGARHQTQSPVKERIERSTPSPTAERNPQLSTIPSVDTLRSRPQRPASEASDHPTVIPEGSAVPHNSDGDYPHYHTSLKRKLTKHSDLISVLSMSQQDNPGLKSARSIRTRRVHADSATTGDLMNEVTTDELKYQRELRTLVDGVIPVLLTHVLQKSDATGNKRLFSGSSPAGQAVTKPVVDMGVALERLKALHRRIPMHESDDLLKWADTATKAYTDYLKVWRMGFHDIIVNLAPADEKESVPKPSIERPPTGDAERVDVAYLLKRPLVRLKHFTKTFKSINQVKPSPLADNMAKRFHELVEEARQRSNDERARLEDEAAASIDPTRARDPRSLAPLTGVGVDATRSVRARDYFDMDLNHSSGQQLTCKIETILRDDAPERGNSSDILFCEVSNLGRWLLFPPMPASYVSAREGDRANEIVVMVRGMLAGGKEWREIMTLSSDDEGAIDEWLDMLSSSPVPPKFTRQSSFKSMREPYVMSGALGGDSSSSYRPPSPSEVDVPIGEQAISGAQQWDDETNSVIGDLPGPSLRRTPAKKYRERPLSPSTLSQSTLTASTITATTDFTANTRDTYEQVRARANKIASRERYDDSYQHHSRSKYHDRPRPKSSYHLQKSSYSTSTLSSFDTPKKDYSVWLPSSDREPSDDSASEEESPDHHYAPRPRMHRRTSSVPSMEMPTVNKIRKPSPQETPTRQSNSRRSEPNLPSQQPEPTSAPAKLHKRKTTPPKEDPKKRDDRPPPTSTHGRSTTLGMRTSLLPSFTPEFLKRHRRTSSPLKHEYAPSSDSESLSSESDYSGAEEAESVTSEEDAVISTVGELKDFRNPPAFSRPMSMPPPPKSDFSTGGDDSLGPSDSASQSPYRSVPQQGNQPAKTVAQIFGWSDRGLWDSMHPEECTIIVSPGLIEAFDLAQAANAPIGGDGPQASPSQRGVKPLVALELTPLVPLRRGTALDISIRSPPTTNSVLRTSANIMFRSRSPEECERLYSLINRARIDNPTYIALQNARGPVPTSNWAEIMDKRNAERSSGNGAPSWLKSMSRRGSTYRSSKISKTASRAATESSVGTTNSAVSALRRFNDSGKGLFNIAKSTLTSREGTRSTNSDSLSSGAATPMAIDPSMGTPAGITNAKIRLYIRESASKWRDMGSARLTVMFPPRPDPTSPADPKTMGVQKRILVFGKSKGETLVDATLPESCFERVARTGIAVSVWEDGGVGSVGGVNSARARVYMLQMKSERDAVYTFGMVGKFRY